MASAWNLSEVRSLEAMEEKEEDDERREAAIASTPSLQPDFIPKGITDDQLSKFHELHKRRLQIKSRSKMKKKTKDGTGKSHTKYYTKDYANEVEASTISTSASHPDKKGTHFKQKGAGASLLLKKPQKLHWGLDSKERWERKANM